MLDWSTVGQELRARLDHYEKKLDVRGAGEVISCGDGIVCLSGLDGCKNGELIEFESGSFAITMNLEEDSVSAVLLEGDEAVSSGMRGFGTGQVLSVPCGRKLLGRVVNPIGQPLDEAGVIHADEYRPIEAPAPSILNRQPVNKPLETGLLSVDSMVAIGRGQRELIIGDRQSGKTAVALDTIINQKGKGVACVYVAIGQKASSVAHLIEQLREAGALAYTTIVCATASDSSTMQYIAPYCGCAMAEYFMMKGEDALIVYDDLTRHAIAYRAMSLLLRRPPGREAYPGDVFYLHSRLLERAAHLSDELGAGSLTALPIVETQTGDISAYIPTNVISITDGQIFLDTDLFRAGVRPAVNGGLSVSRVGGAAQTKAMRSVAGQLRLELAQYREMQVFAQFSSDMDKSTQDMLEYGAMLTEMLKQPNGHPLSMPVQVAMLYVVTRKLLPKNMPVDKLQKLKRELPELLENNYPMSLRETESSGKLTPEVEETFRRIIAAWIVEAGL
ncbi:MAG: F0F1 ATP synthase subunit alpha [Clostridia bacterium]